jgi:hypothetical protein
MKLEYYFDRTEATFGTDPVPANAAYLARDNVFHAPQYGVYSEPVASLAVAYEAPAGAGDATLELYLWDDQRDRWYLFATDDLPNGEIHYISLPNIIDRQDSRARNRIDVAIVAGTDGATPAGTYTLTMSSSTGQVQNFGDLIALLTTIAGDTTSLDSKIENPMPVEGATAVGDVPTSDPLDLGAVVLDADPAPYTDGDIQRLRLDDVGRLIVTDPSASPQIQGIDADDDPVTVNPIVVGGVYYSDPTADTIDDGDVGYALLNELRMLVVEDRAYDAASDANRNIPVWNPTDLWTPEDLSGSATADGTESYYVSLEENSRWSLQYIPSEGSTEVITLEVYQSNENDPDITARTYTEVTSTFFGAGGFTAETWLEIENPTRALSLRVDVSVSGSTGATSEWDLWLVKGGNS